MTTARCRGAVSATLEVAAGNMAALALYRAAGFTTRGRRRGYYRDGGDALIQWAALTGPGEPGSEDSRSGFG